MAIMQDTLSAFEQINQAGTIVDLAYQWRSDDSWKDGVMRPKAKLADGATTDDENHADDRVERFDTPQYQSLQDAEKADSECPSCIFLEANS